jgi:hypothetical protein
MTDVDRRNEGLKWPKSDVNSISQDWRQYRFARFDNSFPAGHNSSPQFLLKDNCACWFTRQEIWCRNGHFAIELS